MTDTIKYTMVYQGCVSQYYVFGTFYDPQNIGISGEADHMTIMHMTFISVRTAAYLDYTPLEDMVVIFPASVARVCFNVNITDDDVLERPTSACDDPKLFEYASVSITRASTPQATGWMSSTAELVIEDDDGECV